MRVLGRLLAWLVLLTGLSGSAAAREDIAPAQRVTIGLYVNDIQAIDLASYSFGVDFYLWFRWNDPEGDPVAGFEYMNMTESDAHIEEPLYEAAKPQPDGSLYQIVRHQGRFSAKYSLSDYPFDTQLLTLSIEDSTAGADTLRYVGDAQAITLNADIVLPGYRLGKPRLIIREKPYETTFGDLSEPDVSAYSRAEFVIPITRPLASGVFKIFVPVLLIILSAAFALLLDPEHVDARIGLSITALLTLVAMQFTMLSGLPEVAYLTLLDQVYLASYLYILVVIGFVVRATRIDEQGVLQGSRGAMLRIGHGGPALAAGVTGVYVSVIVAIILGNVLTPD